MYTQAKRKMSASAIVGVVLCILLIPILLFNSVIIIKGLVDPDNPPSIFGVYPFVVVTDSMYVEKGDIKGGDLIFSKKVDPDTLEKGDIISFWDAQGSITTHRIVQVLQTEEGPAFYTKGDANPTQDQLIARGDDPIAAADVVGLYKSRIGGVGKFAMFLQQPLGLLCFAGIPILLFIIHDVLQKRMVMSQKDAKNKALEEELERLRRKEAEKSPASEAGHEDAPSQQ
ncbi:MAG: signal peptidase I [Eubacteriales bacterium]